MSLVKWNNTRFPALFDEFFVDSPELFPAFNNRLSQVAVNIMETDKAYNLEVVAPGLHKDDFNIAIDNQTLFISYEKEDRKEEKEMNYTRKEYSFNSFSRSFRLPENTLASDIDAKYEEGILKVVIKKKEVKDKKVLSVQVK